jgi:hypothetical protein
MGRPRVNKDFLPSEDESGSTTDTTIDSDDFSDDSSDGDTDDEAWLFDEVEGRLVEYYLNESANLDVARLRQKRYRPRIQGRLDWVKEHWYR